MLLRSAKWMLLVLLFSFLGGSFASAQEPYRRYPGGTLNSPYFQYFRRDRGPFGQYLSFVRPRAQLQNYLQTQEGQLNLLQGELRQIGEQDALQQTGQNSNFMTHQLYFQNQNAFYRTR